MSVLFSIVVVSLNSGDKLRETVAGIVRQGYEGTEIIVKDGLSTDGSVEALRETYEALCGEGGQKAWEDPGILLPGKIRLRIASAPDTGIYDAMNQAAELAEGKYVLFLNCGDAFYGDGVLAKAAKAIEAVSEGEDAKARRVFYGDTFCERTGAMVHSAPVITGFTCYRNIPCHQSCFYDRRLFAEKRYEVKYRIRADYEHFLWCYYRAGAEMIYLDMPVSSYEGGGYSEDRANREEDRAEHKEITSLYMSRKELARYRLIMALTLAPLRRFAAENSRLSGLYHKAKDWIYRR